MKLQWESCNGELKMQNKKSLTVLRMRLFTRNEKN
jgi:hypothetical protein